MPAQATSAQVRYAEGSPSLEALVGGVPTDIGLAYLQVDGATVASSFPYGTITPFQPLRAGAHSLRALDELGYAVGPLKTPKLSAGHRYSLVIVGAYPKYEVLAFEEPASTGDAQLSLYEASPAVPRTGFGRFRASSHSNFSQLGTASLGDVATVSLGDHVTDFGAYAGSPKARLGALTPAQINSFDSHNILPFHVASRLSLFLFDPKSGSAGGPLFGTLDQ